MKTCISMWSLHKYWYAGEMDVLQYCQWAAGTGADGVELLNMFWKDMERELPQVAEILAKAGVTLEQASQWILEAMAECAAFAREHGVVLALENHGLLAGKSSQVAEILASVGSPALKANIDTANWMRGSWRISSAVRAVGLRRRSPGRTACGRWRSPCWPTSLPGGASRSPGASVRQVRLSTWRPDLLCRMNSFQSP